MSYPMRETDTISWAEWRGTDSHIFVDVFIMLDSCTCITVMFHVFFTQRHADLRHPPHAHAVIFHPQTWCMMVLVIVGIVMTDQRWLRVII